MNGYISANFFGGCAKARKKTTMNQTMNQIKIKDEYIKLGQALKLAGMVGSGVEAKIVIQDGKVSVNGEVELQRGKKLHDGDIISFNGEEAQIQA